MKQLPLETLGGFFVAVPENELAMWPGSLEGNGPQLYEMIALISNWLDIKRYSNIPFLIFGGDITSFELAEFQSDMIAVRRLFTAGGDLNNLFLKIFKQEPDEILLMENSPSRWAVFDSARAGTDIVESGDYLIWNFKNELSNIKTYYYEDNLEGVIVHIASKSDRIL